MPRFSSSSWTRPKVKKKGKVWFYSWRWIACQKTSHTFTFIFNICKREVENWKLKGKSLSISDLLSFWISHDLWLCFFEEILRKDRSCLTAGAPFKIEISLVSLLFSLERCSAIRIDSYLSYLPLKLGQPSCMHSFFLLILFVWLS